MPRPTSRLQAYTGPRTDLLALLPPLAPESLVVDVGCSAGALGRAVQAHCGSRVIGIELDQGLADQAAHHLDRVLSMDAGAALRRLAAEGTMADVVIFGDVLEHLLDPWGAVDDAAQIIPTGGWILISVPNVAHVSTHLALLRGTWPRRPRGLHDASHLRWFARRDLEGLVERRRLRIDRVSRTFRLLERPSRVNRWFSWLGWAWPNLFTYQFLVLARVIDDDRPRQDECRQETEEPTLSP